MIQNDLYVIFEEYRTYFEHASVVKTDVKPDSENNQHALHLETKEGDVFNVGICNSGWFVFGRAITKYYETFEGLMNDIYPGFRPRFANDLFAKLNILADQR